MSTPCIIGVSAGDGWERGRYVHSDGYPSWMGVQLKAIVNRDGLTAAVETLLEKNWGWTTVRASQPDIRGVRGNPTAGYEDPAWVAYHFRSKHGAYAGGEWKNVPGYGVAWTDKHDGADQERWVDHTDDGGAEWAYALGEGGVAVYQQGDWRNPVGFVPWHADVDKDAWYAIECGPGLERCTHCAFVHFPEAEGCRLGVDKWLGVVPLDADDACAVRINGVDWEIRGGRLERGPQGWTNHWHSFLRHPDTGEEREVFTRTTDHAPAPGVELVYPRIKGQ